VFFYPVLLSPVVVALIWKWILQREGVLNAGMIGLGGSPVNWLLDSDWAFFWIVWVSIWAHLGFYTLILLAGLQAIPKDVYEAAEMDAATPWRTFSRITLPLLMPNMLVVLVLALIKGVQTFDEVFVLTGGGPGRPPCSSSSSSTRPASRPSRACPASPPPPRSCWPWC
jgi:alpha-1,4-digalacturonate transport system permease protein